MSSRRCFCVYIEIATHIITWILFFWIDGWAPLTREILPEEMWKYKYPRHEELVTNCNLYILVLCVPSVIIFLISLISKNKRLLRNGLFCLSISLALTGLITSLIKVTVSRPRPDFYCRCFPSGTGTDLNCCEGSKDDVDAGRKSFPSGHASLSFCAMTILGLLFSSKFKLFKPEGTGRSFGLFVCAVPFVVASMVAVSRFYDNHHHIEDVFGGGILGTTIAYICYKQFFLDEGLSPKEYSVKQKSTQTGCVMHMQQ